MPQYSSKDGGLSVKQLPNGWLRAVLRWGTKGKVVSSIKKINTLYGPERGRRALKPTWKRTDVSSTLTGSTN